MALYKCVYYYYYYYYYYIPGALELRQHSDESANVADHFDVIENIINQA